MIVVQREKGVLLRKTQKTIRQMHRYLEGKWQICFYCERLVGVENKEALLLLYKVLVRRCTVLSPCLRKDILTSEDVHLANSWDEEIVLS